MKKLGLLAAPLMTLSILASCGGGTKPEPVKKWYKYDDWWNYCSNGIKGSQATKYDIGREVEVDVNGIAHKVRLIGVDHPISIQRTEAEAHCTFEFENVLWDYDSDTQMQTYWWEGDEKDRDNGDFPNSKLNIFLNGENGSTKGSVFAMLSKDLQGAIKKVTKEIGLKPKGGQWSVGTYETKLFPLSYKEMYYADDAYEGCTYGYYEKLTTSECRIKYSPTLGHTAHAYWLRSPSPDVVYQAYQTGAEGHMAANAINTNRAIAPAFCI